MKEGDLVSNFVLKDQNGNDFALYDNLEKNVLLVFYPKDETPVCSSQLADYNSNFDHFINKGIKVIGINTGSVESHSAFCNKLKLKFPLLSDENKVVSKAFGAVNYFGVNKRMLVLIGTDKKILWIHSSLPMTFTKSDKILEKSGNLSKEMT